LQSCYTGGNTYYFFVDKISVDQFVYQKFGYPSVLLIKGHFLGERRELNLKKYTGNKKQDIYSFVSSTERIEVATTIRSR